MKTISYRPSVKISLMLSEISQQPATATSTAIDVFSALRRTTINELKGKFVREELIALLDSYNGLIPTWEIIPSVEAFAWHTEEAEKYEGSATRHGADIAVLIEKINSMTPAQVAILQLELWAFWNRTDEPQDVENFVKRFV